MIHFVKMFFDWTDGFTKKTKKNKAFGPLVLFPF